MGEMAGMGLDVAHDAPGVGGEAVADRIGGLTQGLESLRAVIRSTVCLGSRCPPMSAGAVDGFTRSRSLSGRSCMACSSAVRAAASMASGKMIPTFVQWLDQLKASGVKLLGR